MAKETFTRGSKQMAADIQTRLIELGANEKSTLNRKARPIFIGISIDAETGDLKEVVTTFTEWDEAGTTKVNTKQETMQTNEADKVHFKTLLENIISPSLINGYVRKVLGYNRQPLFDANGVRIPDTAYDINAEPTRDYKTHNSDGTPIT